MTLRTTEPILGRDGEVIRGIGTGSTQLRRDFEWLEDKGHKIFANLFRKQVQLKIERKNVPQYLRAENVLRRSCYIIGAQLNERDHCGSLENYFQWKQAKTKKVAGIHTSANENPFFLCLHLIHQNESRKADGPKIWLTRDQKAKSAKLLKYAYDNKIPPHYLIGFLLQVGTNEILRRAEASEAEANGTNQKQQIDDSLTQKQTWMEILKVAHRYRNRRKKNSKTGMQANGKRSRQETGSSDTRQSG